LGSLWSGQSLGQIEFLPFCHYLTPGWVSFCL
jgi:hypothetical protein